MSDAETEHVSSIAELCVFGVRSAWCIILCPACDAEGFVQEDVHPVPVPAGACCAFKHAYRFA